MVQAFTHEDHYIFIVQATEPTWLCPAPGEDPRLYMHLLHKPKKPLHASLFLPPLLAKKKVL